MKHLSTHHSRWPNDTTVRAPWPKGFGAGQRVRELLAEAEVNVDGNQPWDIRVHDQRFYRRVLAQGSLGLGESYMEGWWDCEQLDEFICRLVRARLDERIQGWQDYLLVIASWLSNRQKGQRAREVAKRHYDVGNDLFEAMLGPTMAYTCGYWRHADTLDQAQTAKLDLVCRKLGLAPGMTLLDIGCGWGSLLRHAAAHYGVQAVGVTISAEQAAWITERADGLPITVHLCDYRDIPIRANPGSSGKTFDRVASLGMFEHVGYRNYRTFMTVVRNALAPDGFMLLQTIGGRHSVTRTDAWLARYVFPNSMLPSAGQIASAAEGLLALRDWHVLADDYERTLLAWHRNFEAAWPELGRRYDHRFYRMWRYYLLLCAGAFRAHSIYLWQIVLNPEGAERHWWRPETAA